MSPDDKRCCACGQTDNRFSVVRATTLIGESFDAREYDIEENDRGVQVTHRDTSHVSLVPWHQVMRIWY